MVIKCATEADAIQVIILQDLVKDMQNKTAMEIALVFHHGFDDEQIAVTGPFYSVCISSHPAIYIDWYVLNLCFVCLLNHVPCRNEAASTLAGWTYPRWARHDTLKAAIIFMIMKGKEFTPNVIDEGIRTQSLTKPHMRQGWNPVTPAKPGKSIVQCKDKGKGT